MVSSVRVEVDHLFRGEIRELIVRMACVKKTRDRHAVRKMEVDPPEPSCRRAPNSRELLQSRAVVVNIHS